MELNSKSWKKTVGNAERNKENRKQFRCDLRWLNKEFEWLTVARLPSRLLTSGCGEKCYLDEWSMRDQLKSLSHHWRDGATSTWVSPSEESGKTANRCYNIRVRDGDIFSQIIKKNGLAGHFRPAGQYIDHPWSKSLITAETFEDDFINTFRSQPLLNSS